MNSLKSCPWCGTPEHMHIEAMWHGSHGYCGCYSYEVYCPKCGAVAPHGKFDTIYQTAEEAESKALMAWNTRKE